MADISTAQIAAQQALLASLVNGSQALTLVEGRSIDARIQQIISDGLVRVLTAQGAIDIATRATLAVGNRVSLQVVNTSGQLALSVVPQEGGLPRLVDGAARIVTGASSPAVNLQPRPSDTSEPAVLRQQSASANPSSTRSAGSAASPAAAPPAADSEGVIVNVRSAATNAAPASPAPASLAVAATLSQALSSSLATQGALAPLFANLAALQQRPKEIPEDIRGALSRANGVALKLDDGVSAPQLTEAIANSGVFLENALAGGNDKTILANDVKAVLLTLRDQLTKLLPQPTASTAAVQGGAAEAGEVLAPAEGPRATPAAIHDGSERPAPPRRGEIPDAQSPASPSLAPGASAKELASLLLDQTEAALSRIRLSQLASRHGDQLVAAGDNRLSPSLQTSYYVEIPVQFQQQTTTLQVAVEREAHGNGVEGVTPTYRLWFALDSEPAGPVSAVITWQPGNAAGGVNATLWAERETTGRALREGLSDLRQELRKADLSVGEVAARLGKAQRQVQGGGHFVDRST